MSGTDGAPYAVLFLCTGNAARSILAEAILNRLGAPNLKAYSAGVRPKGEVNPQALALLKRLGYATEGLRSKSWDEFAGPGAPLLDCVITVCDEAARQACPVWPGEPVSDHWSIPDPSAAEGADASLLLAKVYELLLARITALCVQRLAMRA